MFTYIYMCAWLHTGDAITRRIREAYLSALLRQDVSYFDAVGAGEVTNRLQTDMHLIQEGISDKIPISVMLISTFVSGLIVAFIRSWKLTLALMSVIPCIVVTGFLMNAVISKLQIVELQLVSDAANVALVSGAAPLMGSFVGYLNARASADDTWTPSRLPLGPAGDIVLDSGCQSLWH